MGRGHSGWLERPNRLSCRLRSKAQNSFSSYNNWLRSSTHKSAHNHTFAPSIYFHTKQMVKMVIPRPVSGGRLVDRHRRFKVHASSSRGGQKSSNPSNDITISVHLPKHKCTSYHISRFRKFPHHRNGKSHSVLPRPPSPACLLLGTVTRASSSSPFASKSKKTTHQRLGKW